MCCYRIVYYKADGYASIKIKKKISEKVLTRQCAGSNILVKERGEDEIRKKDIQGTKGRSSTGKGILAQGFLKTIIILYIE